MKLLLNNFAVDFKLEAERTVAEVTRSVSEWARDRDLIFYEFFLDGDHYYVDAAPDVPVDSAEQMNCLIQSRADVVIQSIEEGARYCDRIVAFMDSRTETGPLGDEDAAQLAAGAAWLGEMAAKALSLLGANPESVKNGDITAAKCVASLADIAARPAETAPDDVKTAMNALKEMLRSLLLGKEMKSLIAQSIDSPDTLSADLERCADELDEQKASIEAAAVAFQTGRDADGSEKLSTFTDYIFRLARIFYQSAPVFGIDLGEIVVNGEPLEERIARIKDLLVAVTDSMENGDIVSLCDVLEYEMRPALDGIDEYVGLMRTRIS